LSLSTENTSTAGAADLGVEIDTTYNGKYANTITVSMTDIVTPVVTLVMITLRKLMAEVLPIRYM
jgi:hypothetical protein